MKCRESERYFKLELKKFDPGDRQHRRARIARSGDNTNLRIYTVGNIVYMLTPVVLLTEETYKTINKAWKRLIYFADEVFKAVPKTIWTGYTYDIYKPGSAGMYVYIKQFANDPTWYWYATYFRKNDGTKTVARLDSVTFGSNIQTDERLIVQYVGCESRQAALKEALEHIRTTDDKLVRAELEKWKHAIPAEFRCFVFKEKKE